MFHVKQHRFLGLFALVGLMGLAIGCLGQVGARGWAGPVRFGDLIIVSTGDGRLDAIDSEGRVVWRFPELWAIAEKDAEDLDGIYGTPLIASYDGVDVVFVGDYNGFVYAFRPSDFEPGVTINSPPAAFFELDGSVIGGMALDTAADALYVTSGERVYALRASDLVRRIDSRDAQVAAAGPPPEGESPGVFFVAGEDIWGEPVLADGKLLVSSLDGGLYAIDPSTGAEIWHFEAEQGLVSTPTVAGNVVLVSGFGSTLYGVDLADGSAKWTFKTNHWIWGKAAVDGDIAYVGDFDGVVHAIELGSGTESWSLALDHGALRASPVLSAGTLVVSSDGDWLVGVDVATRSVAWERELGTKLNADLTADGGDVLLAPRGCVTPEGASERVYYTKVDPRNGDLTSTPRVC
ncbi:MAG TPA: PQQ-binding-like beta-propeller repeat protein [Dehalococcoidia bacterium]|nr:PQQ-binding-like beta-propeller repeat protein [Dehalococcoidia bacterium]